ncbi:hypothetical protein [Alteromonas facilis]|uniref:hypothetical protein n=1 Tax=Alteromonas facilis TaxID=2048004 RepID=UPI000C28C2C3|nr:hypothetical protein [Alteromonas facilis]
MRRLSLLALILLIFPGELVAENGDSVVIAHPQVAQSSVNHQQLRRIFLLKQRTWDDGSPISLIVFASDNNTHSEFLRQRLKMFPYQLEREWNKLIYSGQSAPPVVATNTEDMLNIVASTPGAIGYLVTQQPAMARHGRVKIIEVTNE